MLSIAICCTLKFDRVHSSMNFSCSVFGIFLRMKFPLFWQSSLGDFLFIVYNFIYSMDVPRFTYCVCFWMFHLSVSEFFHKSSSCFLNFLEVSFMRYNLCKVKFMPQHIVSWDLTSSYSHIIFAIIKIQKSSKTFAHALCSSPFHLSLCGACLLFNFKLVTGFPVTSAFLGVPKKVIILLIVWLLLLWEWEWCSFQPDTLFFLSSHFW